MEKAWKRSERRTATFFGTVRNPLSGADKKVTGSDSMHPRLFIENKYSKAHAIFTIYRKAKAQAIGEKKIPIVTLDEKGKRGFLICVHCDDWNDLHNYWLKTKREWDKNEPPV